MKYISTRNKNIQVSPSQAIIQGISGDGGLFVPSRLPLVNNLDDLKDMDYKDLALFVMNLLLPDIDLDKLKKSIEKAYKQFTAEEIAPLVEVDGTFFLELFHGPTFAFKDIALSILPHLLSEAIKINKIEEEVIILTATSGDTGKAALEGFAGVEGVKIIVFFPENGVSKIQKLQMLTQEGDNTFIVGINGDFDMAQNGVKEIFNDINFVEKLNQDNFILSSANSINIGRLVPQIVYYFHSYLSLLRRGSIKPAEKINFSVPTGNFGNILAAYYAKKMGLPINKLICASNENNVLSDFLNTCTYDKNRELKLTSSPSMDILVSSNLERLLFHLSGEDDSLIKEKMDQLSNNGLYNMDIDLKDFYGSYSREEEISSSIRRLFEDSKYLMDPHTAVAYNVYEKYRESTNDNSNTVIVSTASPYKFGRKVANSIGLNTENKEEFQILRELEDISNIDIPSSIEALKNKPIIHNNNCNKEDMKKIIQVFLGGDSKDD